jgi:hypothetical protein
MEPRVRAITFKKGKIIIEHQQESKKSGTVEDNRKSSNDPPMPAFSRAWDAMLSHYRKMLELPKEYIDRLSIETVKIDRQEEMVSCSIVGHLSFENAKGTSKLPTAQYSWDTTANAEDQGGKKNRMTEEIYEDLIDLESKALLYVEGERAQLELAMDGGGPGVEIDENDEEELDVNEA